MDLIQVILLMEEIPNNHRLDIQNTANNCIFAISTGAGFRVGLLVSGFNPSEQYARQIGNLPQVRMKINSI